MGPDNKLVLYDFDGTITTKDTLFEFCRFIAGDLFIVKIFVLLPVLLAQRLTLMSAQKAKEIFLAFFLKELHQSEFDYQCQLFADKILPGLIRPQALKSIQDYKNTQARIVIVSASPQNWILPWAGKVGAEVIATQLVIEKGKITGKIQGRNCNGEEKVNRIRELIDLASYQEVIAFGDTQGDMPMLALATQKFFKPFRGKS